MAIPAYNEIAETLKFLPDWEERYSYLIEMGRALPPMPETLKTEALLVPGCTSRVWLLAEKKAGTLNLVMDSDALIVKGLLAVLWSLYNGKTPQQAIEINVKNEFLDLGLEGHLSPNRRNGFFAVADRIAKLAAV